VPCPSNEMLIDAEGKEVWERCSELAPLRRLELAPPERPIVT